MLGDLTEVVFELEGPCARLIFNRPEHRNALSPTLIEEALRVSRFVEAAKDVRVLLISARGRAFCAGVDVKAAAQPGHDRKRFAQDARELIATWERMPQATIAVVDGACFAGGLSLVLAMDFIVCSPDATFCDSHAKYGLRSSWGLSQRLPRLIGLQRARRMSFTAQVVGGEEAAAIGLALECAPSADLEACAMRLADEICAVSGGSVAAYKDLYQVSQNLALADGLRHEATAKYFIEDRAGRGADLARAVGRKTPPKDA